MIETMEIDGFAAVRLRCADGLAATFVPGAGMLGVSLTDGGEELLGQRHGLDSYVEKARTMGLPLLHPWANRLSRDAFRVAGVDVRMRDGEAGFHRDGNGLAIHGLMAGAAGWAVEPTAAGDDAFAAVFDFGAHPELLATFPFPHTLRIEVALRQRTLRVTTTLTATGVFAVPVAYGFHPYLTLPGVAREQWQVELPALERLGLDARGLPTGASTSLPGRSEPLGERSLDHAFGSVAEGATFAVSSPGRRIEIRFERGFPATQVFAPLSETVICFEPMTAPTNALVSGDGLRLVAPGQSDVTAFSITVG